MPIPRSPAATFTPTLGTDAGNGEELDQLGAMRSGFLFDKTAALGAKRGSRKVEYREEVPPECAEAEVVVGAERGGGECVGVRAEEVGKGEESPVFSDFIRC